MASNRESADRALELLAPLGQVRARAMFGGFGIYAGDSPMFALIAEDVLYFKVDEESKAEFAEAGGRPFIWQAPGKDPVEMSYWTPPGEAADDARAIEPWARRGLEAATRAKQAKKK